MESWSVESPCFPHGLQCHHRGFPTLSGYLDPGMELQWHCQRMPLDSGAFCARSMFVWFEPPIEVDVSTINPTWPNWFWSLKTNLATGAPACADEHLNYWRWEVVEIGGRCSAQSVHGHWFSGVRSLSLVLILDPNPGWGKTCSSCDLESLEVLNIWHPTASRLLVVTNTWPQIMDVSDFLSWWFLGIGQPVNQSTIHIVSNIK